MLLGLSVPELLLVIGVAFLEVGWV